MCGVILIDVEVNSLILQFWNSTSVSKQVDLRQDVPTDTLDALMRFEGISGVQPEFKV